MDDTFNLERFLRRAHSVQNLINSATIAGEREGATRALNRLITQAEQSASPTEIAIFRARLVEAKPRSQPEAAEVRDDIAFAAWVKRQMNEAVEEARKIREKREVEKCGEVMPCDRMPDFVAATEIAAKMANQTHSFVKLEPDEWQARMQAEAAAALAASTKNARDTMAEIKGRRGRVTESVTSATGKVSRLRAALNACKRR